MKQIDLSNKPDELWENHGMAEKWVPVDKKADSPRLFADVAPTKQVFSEGNGGESRKSFHGYPNGFAQLIESPQSWNMIPMQIDSECNPLQSPSVPFNSLQFPSIQFHSIQFPSIQFKSILDFLAISIATLKSN
jgi:hypothetical protein